MGSVCALAYRLVSPRLPDFSRKIEATVLTFYRDSVILCSCGFDPPMVAVGSGPTKLPSDSIRSTFFTRQLPAGGRKNRDMGLLLLCAEKYKALWKCFDFWRWIG